MFFLLWALQPSGDAGDLYTVTFCLFYLFTVLPKVSEETVSPTRARNMKDFENVSGDTKFLSLKIHAHCHRLSRPRREPYFSTSV